MGKILAPSFFENFENSANSGGGGKGGGGGEGGFNYALAFSN